MDDGSDRMAWIGLGRMALARRPSTSHSALQRAVGNGLVAGESRALGHRRVTDRRTTDFTTARSQAPFSIIITDSHEDDHQAMWDVIRAVRAELGIHTRSRVKSRVSLSRLDIPTAGLPEQRMIQPVLARLVTRARTSALPLMTHRPHVHDVCGCPCLHQLEKLARGMLSKL